MMATEPGPQDAGGWDDPERAELLGALMSGELTSAQTERLLELVRRDEKLAGALVDDIEVDRLLRFAQQAGTRKESFRGELMRELRAFEDRRRFRNATMKRIKARTAGTSRRSPVVKRRRRWADAAWRRGIGLSLGAILAAAAVLFVVAYVGTDRPTGSERAADGVRRVGARSPVETTASASDNKADARANAHDIPALGPRSPGKTATPDSAVDRAAAARGPEATTDATGPGDAVAEQRIGTDLVPSQSPKTGGVAFLDGDAHSRSHEAYVDRVERIVERRRAGEERWERALAGAPLRVGDRLRTKLSRARVVFESGTAVWANQFTTLDLSQRGQKPGLAVVGGEVYVETVPHDAGFFVETPHGVATDLGTRFDVDVKPRGTTVVVVQGTVEATTDVGSVSLGENREVLLARRAARPGEVRSARDVAARLSWVEEMKPAGPVEDIVLLPRDAKVVGQEWRLVRDEQTLTGFALEAPLVTNDWSWAEKRWPGRRQSYLAFTFRADAEKDHHIWIRGRCMAVEKRGGRDAVGVELPGAQFSRVCRWLGRSGLNAHLFDNYQDSAGYMWVGGNQGGADPDTVAISARFRRPGRQVLIMYGLETPMRIDAIWLSTCQRTRPAPEQPLPGLK